MAEIEIPQEVPARYLARSRGATLTFGLLTVVGLVAFLLLLGRDSTRAWSVYISSWLYFTSVAMGAVVLVVAATITKSKWNWSVRRVGVAFAAFLPVAFLLFLPMLGVAADFLPWVAEIEHDPIVQKKAAWLNLPFLYARNVLGLLVLFGLTLYFAYLNVRPDLGLAEDGDGSSDSARAKWRQRLMGAWRGQESEEVRSYRRMVRVAPGLALLFAVILSMVSYDWAMALEPHWFSTLFGGWFFMGAFWGGIAATALTVVWLKGKDRELDRMMGKQQLHDLGKLAFAFSIFWTYLFWSQYIVIWYGKLPWEQAWIVHRSGDVWGGLSLLTIVLCFVIPFAGLIGRAPKLNPKLLGTFTGIILVGLWLERYLMVAPSVRPEGDPVISLWEPLVTLLFLGPFLGSVRWALTTFPVVQRWQPMVEPEMLEAEMHGAGPRYGAEVPSGD